MKSFAIAAFVAGCFSILVGCDNSESAKTSLAQQTAYVIKESKESPAAEHTKAVEAASNELREILKPEDTGTAWEAGLAGTADGARICSLEGRYRSLERFISEHSNTLDAAIKMPELSGLLAQPDKELRNRGVAYFSAFIAAVKADRIPGCLNENDETDGAWKAEFIYESSRDLENLKVTPQEVGITPEELRAFYLRECKREIPALLANYRRPKTVTGTESLNRNAAIQRLVRLVKERHFSAAELGIPNADYGKFLAAQSQSNEGGYCLPGECDSEEGGR